MRSSWVSIEMQRAMVASKLEFGRDFLFLFYFFTPLCTVLTITGDMFAIFDHRTVSLTCSFRFSITFDCTSAGVPVTNNNNNDDNNQKHNKMKILSYNCYTMQCVYASVTISFWIFSAPTTNLLSY